MKITVVVAKRFFISTSLGLFGVSVKLDRKQQTDEKFHRSYLRPLFRLFADLTRKEPQSNEQEAA
jgi:hypothetical protein